MCLRQHPEQRLFMIFPTGVKSSRLHSAFASLRRPSLARGELPKACFVRVSVSYFVGYMVPCNDGKLQVAVG